MVGLPSWIRHHPVSAFAALTFGLTWSAILALLGPAGFREAFQGDGVILDEVGAEQGLVYGAMLAGPSLASLILTARLEGQEGIRRLGASLIRWRVPLRWYVVAGLSAPAVAISVLATLALASPVFQRPEQTGGDQAALLSISIIVGLTAGIFEELGWTGFALPRLLGHRSVFLAGLILGAMWAGWHLLADAWMFGGYFGGWYPLHFLLYATLLLAFRLLMVWLYRHTESLLVSVLMHTSFTSSLLVLGPSPSDVSVGTHLVWYGAIAVAFWVVAVVLVSGRQLARGPVPA